MPEVTQKLIEDFSFLISIVVPKWLKNFLTLIFGGQIGTGPFFREIGGKGIALTIFAFTLIAFFNCDNVIVEIKLIIVCLGLNSKFLIIFSPTLGVTDKKTQSDWSIICWLLLAMVILLNFAFKLLAISVILEHHGSGSKFAAPFARKVIDFALKKNIS